MPENVPLSAQSPQPPASPDAGGLGAQGATPGPRQRGDASRPTTPLDDRTPQAAASSERGELDRLWAEILGELEQHVQSEQFDTWFRRTALRAHDQGQVVIAVPNAFTADWLNNYYRTILVQAAGTVLGGQRDVRLIVDPELTIAARSPAASPREGTAPGAGIGEQEADYPATEGAAKLRSTLTAPRIGLLSSSDFGLNTSYRFENFVVGPCNRFAHAAALGVSESPGKNYNPFFLHGSVGLGKTHLMQSLCHALLERDPTVRILYLSCETFVNHFISALENGDLQKFRNKYRNVDVLVVDDIHLLANKERTQEEFFHTFNTLHNAGKQIVLSSDSPPKDIPSLQGRLVSRFKWGLVTEVEPPCFETRMAIIKRKSRDRGRELPEDVACLLAERIDSNIRELEGAVTKILGFASLAGLPITVDLARECLRDVFSQRSSTPSMEDVLRIVTEHFGVRPADLQSRKRTAGIVHARQIGMYLARQVTRLSLEEIGGYFGGRDHSTVLYSIQRVSSAIADDLRAKDELTELLSRLRAPSL